jgi:hypothetical protein
MPTFLKYLLSMIVHMMWSRMGKGPVPPIKLPRKGPVNLPIIGPWQVMIGACGLITSSGIRYSRDVKTHLMNAQHPAVAQRRFAHSRPEGHSAECHRARPNEYSGDCCPVCNTCHGKRLPTTLAGSKQAPHASSQSHKTQLLSNGAQAARPTAGNGTPSHSCLQAVYCRLCDALIHPISRRRADSYI